VDSFVSWGLLKRERAVRASQIENGVCQDLRSICLVSSILFIYLFIHLMAFGFARHGIIFGQPEIFKKLLRRSTPPPRTPPPPPQ
jgi:hypothetical protein